MTKLVFKNSLPTAALAPKDAALLSAPAMLAKSALGPLLESHAMNPAIADLLKPKVLKHRKDVYDLTPAEVTALRHAFEKVAPIPDDRGYQHWAGIHGSPPPGYCQHGTPLFAVWHRPYLYLFEKALQDQVPGVMLPYWDWGSTRARAEGMPRIFTDATYVDGAGGVKPNPLLSSLIKFTGSTIPETFRDPGLPGNLGTLAKQVLGAQKQKTYELYSPALENPHNGLHGWVSGTMGSVTYAAFDPIFWAHHANIDRLFAAWQAAHPSVRPIDSIYNAALPPFSLTVKQSWTTSMLGYDYAPPHGALMLHEDFPVPEMAHAFRTVAGASKFNTPLLDFSLKEVLADPPPVMLEFQEVTQPKKSFELRVFFNQPDADATTPTEGNPHFGGSLFFFGHGECAGGAGHCDVPTEPRAEDDLRLPHHLTPMNLRLDVSESLHQLAKTLSAVTMSLVAVDNHGQPVPNPGTDFVSLNVVS
ncbi:MAG: tyrosinase family protein [Byssovorax sp.]